MYIYIVYQYIYISTYIYSIYTPVYLSIFLHHIHKNSTAPHMHTLLHRCAPVNVRFIHR